MIQREKAIKTAANRRIEAPEISRAWDYNIGDVVQLKADGKKYAGKMGVIIGIRAIVYDETDTADLAYTIKLSDKKSIEVSAYRLRFLRHGDEMATEPEQNKGK